MPKLQKYFYGNDGPIIMVQIENEYGAYKICDVYYKNFLRDLTFSFTQDNAVLFTTDWPYYDELHCGKIEGVFATVDFGIASEEQVKRNFDQLRVFQPTGPLVNSEFYPGWLTVWQEPFNRRSASEIAETLEIMLSKHNASVNFYMYFGGTNFGFWAGNFHCF